MEARKMNVYMIEVSNIEAQHNRKRVGYSSANTEYDALKEFGFRHLSLKSYSENQDHKDEWMYTASNAVQCLVYAIRIL
jgi:hypothetical protein